MSNELIIRSKEERNLMFQALIREKKEGFIVNGSALQNALESSLQYSKWIARKIEQNNLVENQDYIVEDKKVLNPNGGRPIKEYMLTVKATQRIAGKDKSEVGFELLDYLFDLSESLLSLTPKTYIQALKALVISEEKKAEVIEQNIKLKLDNNQKQQILEVQKPKVEFFDTVATSKTGIELIQAVKTLNMISPKGKTIGRNELFELLRERGILRANNEPYMKYIDNHYFRVVQKKYTRNHTDGTSEEKMYTQTLIFPRGIENVRQMLLGLGYQKKEDYLMKKSELKALTKAANRKLTYTQLLKELNMIAPTGRDLTKAMLFSLLRTKQILDSDSKPNIEYLELFSIKHVKYVDNKKKILVDTDKTWILPNGVNLIKELLLESGYSEKKLRVDNKKIVPSKEYTRFGE